METEKQATVNSETRKHILQVNEFIGKFVSELLERGRQHDRTKLYDPEVNLFAEYTPKLAQCKYDSEEYKECLKGLKPALDHHYSRNRHHPEHFKNGIADMTLVDLVEMFCDWKAASMRQHDGNLEKSIEKNKDRFGIPSELIKIFENTISVLEG